MYRLCVHVNIASYGLQYIYIYLTTNKQQVY